MRLLSRGVFNGVFFDESIVKPNRSNYSLGELNIGDSFYCLEDLEESLRLYEEKHGIKLYKRDVRSLEALLKRSLKLQKLDKINERLKYGQLLYCCVYGGKRKAQKIACMDERYLDFVLFDCIVLGALNVGFIYDRFTSFQWTCKIHRLQDVYPVCYF